MTNLSRAVQYIRALAAPNVILNIEPLSDVENVILTPTPTDLVYCRNIQLVADATVWHITSLGGRERKNLELKAQSSPVEWPADSTPVRYSLPTGRAGQARVKADKSDFDISFEL
jgi:hypothetical protein